MSTLRTMIVFAILGAVGYGVYATLNRRPPKDPPEAIPDDWANVPVVQMPGDGAGPAPSFPPISMPGGVEGHAAPASGAPVGDAPPFAPVAPSGEAAPAQSAWSDAPSAAQFAGPPTTSAPPNYAANAHPPGTEAPPVGTGAPVADLQPPTTASLDAPPATAFDSTAPATDSAWPTAAPGGAGVAPADSAAPPFGTAPAANTAAPPFDPAQTSASAGDQFAPPAAYPEAAGAPSQIPGDGVAPATAAPFAPVDGAAPPAAGASTPPTGGASDVRAEFASTMTNVRHLLDQDRLADAHLELSRWHNDPRLSEIERREIHDLLDQLAGTVVYSQESLVEPPYELPPGETLQHVADRYQIPWQLLAKINGIADPSQVRPGEKLKVVRGPFSAVVDLNQKLLTLWIEGRYAGSFPIDVGRDQVAPPGNFEVKDKVENPIYYGPDQVIGADDPANPLGERWISLGQQLGIHGSNDPQGPARADERGCIRLSDRDIHDVYDILSVGSKVVIRR
ncbi:MAG: L,D-transpeptidase family protein [Pirellulales bacterium]|nr:L,D-transpeptidase family protein [Pirellulales bacterium]